MGYRLSYDRMDEIITELSSKYRIYAPRFDAQKKRVRYGLIKSVKQIVTDRQSDYSPKEVFYPVSQVMFYFRDDSVEESELSDDREILIIARACDINAIRRQDNIFLKNGGTEDIFYKRNRDKVRFALLECKESFENCFCVSVGSNKTEDYAFAININEEDVLIDVKDDSLGSIFANEDADDYKVRFVEQNKKAVKIPQIDHDNLKAVSELEYWKRFDDTCAACGGCNAVCGTCTCFDTIDIVYDQGSNDGERRRVWSGCMLADFTKTAGGETARKTPGANMRFKVFHKFFDYRERFGTEHMCVGCGRCDIRCPKNISFFDTVCEIHDEIVKNVRK